MKEIKILELFSGYGSQRIALERMGYNVDSDISEINKNAINAYNSMHGETFNYGNIELLDNIEKEYDLMTYSFPCTDLSTAGNQEGLSGKNSGLVNEVIRLLNNSNNKPSILIMENVPTLAKKYREGLEKIKSELESMGYKNYEFLIKGTDVGIPQKRERFFMVSSFENLEIKEPKTYEDIKINLSEEEFYEEKKYKGCNLSGIASGQYQPVRRDYNKLGLKREEWFEMREDGLFNNILTGRKKNMIGYKNEGNCYVRLLNAYETGELMGLNKIEVDKMLSIASENQVIKMHGNSIIVDVFIELLRRIGF